MINTKVTELALGNDFLSVLFIQSLIHAALFTPSFIGLIIIGKIPQNMVSISLNIFQNLPCDFLNPDPLRPFPHQPESSQFHSKLILQRKYSEAIAK